MDLKGCLFLCLRATVHSDQPHEARSGVGSKVPPTWGFPHSLIRPDVPCRVRGLPHLVPNLCRNAGLPFSYWAQWAFCALPAPFSLLWKAWWGSGKGEIKRLSLRLKNGQAWLGLKMCPPTHTHTLRHVC